MQNLKPKKTPWRYLVVLLGFFMLVTPITGCGGGGGGGGVAVPGNRVNTERVTPSQTDQGYRTYANLEICRYGVTTGSYITILWGDQAQPSTPERHDWTVDGCRNFTHYYYSNGNFPYTVTGVNPTLENGKTGSFTVSVTQPNSPTITLTGLNCPTPIYLNQKAACTATTSNGQGTVEINFGDSSRAPVNATSGVPAEFSYNSTGQFTVTAVMKGGGGTPMTTVIQVVPNPNNPLRTPTFGSGFVLRPLQLGSSACFILGNLSGRTKSVRVQNGTTHEYSYNGQNPFSVCPPLTSQGISELAFRAIGNPGEISDPLTTSIEVFTQNPLPGLPDVFCDIDPNNNAQALCEVTKYLGFELWVRPPGGTDSLVPGGGRSSAYTGTDYLNQVTITHPVALQGTAGSQSICFYHKLDGHVDQIATVRKSNELCRTVNGTGNGGTGTGTQTGQNPPSCGSFTISPQTATVNTQLTANFPQGGGTCTSQTIDWGGATSQPSFSDNCNATTTPVTYNGTGLQTATLNRTGPGGTCQQTFQVNVTAAGGGTGTGGTFAYTSEWLSHELEELTTDGTYLYGVNSETGCIYKYNLTGTAQGSSPWCGQVSGMPAGDGLSQPTAITHCNGELIVGDINRRKLFRFNTSGGYIGQINAVPPNSPGFNAITGLGCGTAVGTTKLMVADYSNNRIYVYDATTWGPQWSGSVSQATDAAMDQNGIIYGLSRGGSLERFTNSGGTLTSIASGMSLPTRITITSYTAGVDTLLITENGNSRILVKDVSGATTTTFGGAGNTGGQTSNPSGAVVIGGHEFISVISSTTTDRGRVISF